ncbi:MAG: YciI-like protein [Planctomycetota bacterium]|jgi:uncharacterized protein YciI
MFYLLIYDVAENYIERRAPFREAHLLLAREYAEQGLLVLGGALADPVDAAVLVFETDTIDPIEAFVARDPYVQQGLIRSHRIRLWNVAIDSR